jgi:TPR repeat protein
MFELPPFYFSQQEERLRPSAASSSNATTTNTVESPLLLTMLPSELLHLSLLSYGNYGTIAKLACVRSEWKDMLYDSVQRQVRHQYQLALAMIHGTDGLLPNKARAIQLLQQITSIPIDPITNMPIYTTPSSPDTTTTTTTSTNHDTETFPTTTTDASKFHRHHQNDDDHDKMGTCRLLPLRREIHDTTKPITTWTTNHRRCHGNDGEKEADDECDSIRKAMKTLAYLYLDDNVDDDDNRNDDNDDTSTTEHDPSKKNDISSQKHKQIGMQWLLCAYHIGQDIDAAYEIASIYEYGTYDDDKNEDAATSSGGIPMDLVKAIEYLHFGAQHGHVESMVELALHYEMGCHEILPVNTDRAYYWYHEAAQRGHAIAQYSIGEAYERGIISSSSSSSSSSLSSASMTNMALSSQNTNVNMTLACLYYYQAAMEGNDEDSITALRRLYDIARIVIPGINTKLQLYDKKERILTNE